MFICKEQQLLTWDNWCKNTMIWHEKHYLLFYFQSSNCFTSLFFCMHFCGNKDGRHIVIDVPTSPDKKCWEEGCIIPSWAQHSSKKSFLALKSCTFQVKSKASKKIFNKVGHCNSFFFCWSMLRQWRRLNDPDLFLIVCELIYLFSVIDSY